MQILFGKIDAESERLTFVAVILLSGIAGLLGIGVSSLCVAAAGAVAGVAEHLFSFVEKSVHCGGVF
jgi:hypothetical protein